MKKLILALGLCLAAFLGITAAGQVTAAPAEETTQTQVLETEQVGTYSYINRQCRYVGYSNGWEYWQLYLWWQPSGWEFLMGQRAHYRPYGDVIKKIYYWRNNDANGVACW